MITKILKILNGGNTQEKQTVGSSATIHPIDVPHTVLTQEAQRRHSELKKLVKTGWPAVQREKLKNRVRQKVWEVVSNDFEIEDATIVEEITERIVEVAENDPMYQEMFGAKAAEGN